MNTLELSRPAVRRLIAALLLVEIALLIGKSDHFFNGDSLFFFSNRLDSLEDVWQKFKGPDHLWQYRPMTFVIFSFLLYPLFKAQSLAYNILPILAHLAATLLIYRILRLLGLGRTAAFLGTLFFGVHSVAFYVTYGVAFLPDFTYAFFYLWAILFFLRYLEFKAWRMLAASLAAFFFSLMCKEAAVTLPAIVLFLGWLHPRVPERIDRAGLFSRLRRALATTLPFIVLGFLYITFLWVTKEGRLYGVTGDHPHHANISLDVLVSKYKYLKWAFNLPDGLVFEFESWTNYGVAAGIAVFIVPFVLAAIRKLWRGEPIYWLGVLWFSAALTPVVFLSNLTMHHNLYVPLVGLSAIIGIWLEEESSSILVRSRHGASVFLWLFAASLISATAFHNSKAVRNSWIAEASSFARESLQDLKRQRPFLSENAALYILNSSTKDLAWFYDYGSLFRMFYPHPSLVVKFAPFRGTLPTDLEPGKDWIVLLYDGKRLLDVTRGLP